MWQSCFHFPLSFDNFSYVKIFHGDRQKNLSVCRWTKTNLGAFCSSKCMQWTIININSYLGSHSSTLWSTIAYIYDKDYMLYNWHKAHKWNSWFILRLNHIFNNRVHSRLGYQKGVFKIFKTTKDNFEFLFILHYYSCNGLLCANR